MHQHHTTGTGRVHRSSSSTPHLHTATPGWRCQPVWRCGGVEVWRCGGGAVAPTVCVTLLLLTGEDGRRGEEEEQRRRREEQRRRRGGQGGRTEALGLASRHGYSRLWSSTGALTLYSTLLQSRLAKCHNLHTTKFYTLPMSSYFFLNQKSNLEFSSLLYSFVFSLLFSTVSLRILLLYNYKE